MVLVDLAVLAAGQHGNWRSDQPMLTCAWALALSQISLTAVWVAWGRGWLPIRAACAVFVLTCWSRGLADLVNASDVSNWIAACGLHLLLAGGLVAIVPRMLGWTVVWPVWRPWMVPAGHDSGGDGPTADEQTPHAGEASAPALGRYQFSILYLLVCMTALAVILGMLKLLLRETASLELAFAPRVWLFAALHALVAGVVLSIALGGRRLVLKLAALLVVEAISCSILVWPSWSELDWGLLLHVGEAGLLGGYLLVLRMDGMRLVPSAEQAAANES